MSKLAELITTMAAGRPSSVVRIESELCTLSATLETAHTTYAAACLDAAEGAPGAAERLLQAESERDRVNKRIAQARAALSVAQARAQVAAEAEATAARAAAWETAVAVAEKQYAHITGKLIPAIAALAGHYRTALELREQLQAALPSTPDADAPLLRRDSLETAMRQEMARAGLEFCFSWPWGRTSLPELEKTSSGALGLIRRWGKDHG